MKISVWLGFAR